MLSTVAATLVLFVDARLGYRLAATWREADNPKFVGYEPNGANN